MEGDGSASAPDVNVDSTVKVVVEEAVEVVEVLAEVEMVVAETKAVQEVKMTGHPAQVLLQLY